MLQRIYDRWQNRDDRQKTEYLLMPAFVVVLPICYGIVDIVMRSGSPQFLRWLFGQWWYVAFMFAALIPLFAACFYTTRHEIRKARLQNQLHGQLDLWVRMGYEVPKPPMWAKVALWALILMSAFVLYTAIIDPRPMVRLVMFFFP